MKSHSSIKHGWRESRIALLGATSRHAPKRPAETVDFNFIGVGPRLDILTGAYSYDNGGRLTGLAYTSSGGGTTIDTLGWKTVQDTHTLRQTGEAGNPPENATPRRVGRVCVWSLDTLG